VPPLWRLARDIHLGRIDTNLHNNHAVIVIPSRRGANGAEGVPRNLLHLGRRMSNLAPVWQQIPRHAAARQLGLTSLPDDRVRASAPRTSPRTETRGSRRHRFLVTGFGRLANRTHPGTEPRAHQPARRTATDPIRSVMSSRQRPIHGLNIPCHPSTPPPAGAGQVGCGHGVRSIWRADRRSSSTQRSVRPRASMPPNGR
jgi:hypothetical protein